MRLLKALVGKKRFLLGLEARDLPDKQAGERLGNHVSDRVTNLKKIEKFARCVLSQCPTCSRLETSAEVERQFIKQI